MRAVGVKNSAPERLVRRILHGLGYRFRLHRRDLPGTPDIVFPTRRRVIFVHGCFWHGHDCSRGKLPTSNVAFWSRKIAANRDRDDPTEKQLRRDGWKVLTLWACKMKNGRSLEKRLARFLDRERSNGFQKVSFQ